MNSLSELNNYGNTGFEFTDDRPATYLWDRETPTNQVVTVYENRAVVMPLGIVSTGIVSRTEDLSVTVDLTALPGSILTWPTLVMTPTHSLVVTNPSANVYLISGIRSSVELNKALSFILDVVSNPPSVFTMSTTIHYNVSQTFSWSTVVNIIQLDQLSAASNYNYPSDVPNTITGSPSIVNLGLPDINNDSLVLTVTSSNAAAVSTMSSAGNGGSTDFNYVTKALTITGNLTEVNSHLGVITFTPVIGSEYSFVLFYSLYNPSSGFTSVVSQQLVNVDALYLSHPTTFFYDEDVLKTVTGYSQITNNAADVSTDYSLVVSSIETNVINLMTSNGVGGTSTWNDTSKTLTLTGSKSQINSHLSALQIRPAVDYRGTISLAYSLSVGAAVVAGRAQLCYASTLDTNISNINVSRTFVSNTIDQLVFPVTVPSILEEIASASYTITLSTTAGYFGLSSASVNSLYSFTGSKSQVNAIFSTLKFYPIKDVSGNQTINYTQSRNNVTTVSTTIPYVGSTRVTAIPGIGVVNVTSTRVLTITYEQANYLTAEVLVVGGGGGAGGYTVSGPYTYHGGGGAGGGVLTYSGIRFMETSLVCTLGSTGTHGTNATGGVTATNGTAGISSIISAGGIVLEAYGGGPGTGGRVSGTVNGGTSPGYQITIPSQSISISGPYYFGAASTSGTGSNNGAGGAGAGGPGGFLWGNGLSAPPERGLGVVVNGVLGMGLTYGTGGGQYGTGGSVETNGSGPPTIKINFS